MRANLEKTHTEQTCFSAVAKGVFNLLKGDIFLDFLQYPRRSGLHPEGDLPTTSLSNGPEKFGVHGINSGFTRPCYAQRLDLATELFSPESVCNEVIVINGEMLNAEVLDAGMYLFHHAFCGTKTNTFSRKEGGRTENAIVWAPS